MSRLEGSRLIPFPHERVSASLSDSEFLVRSLDRVDEILEAGPDRAVWKTRLGTGLFSSTVEITLEVIERLADSSRFRATTKATGGGGISEITLQFLRVDIGTDVRYQADILERTGFMKIVSMTLIQSAAKTVIDDTWKSLETKLSAIP
ncbi:CoxG family protein [Zavarzinella formosa]|uniref:CoxG family protein n=1 Tax=Zavarzinella formosa TaxID=360055 RepID=UPI0002DA3D99|nr:SRPBCC domain-containing protein [Zavarzinella formosa]